MKPEHVQDPFASALKYAHSLLCVPCYIERVGETVVVRRSDGSGGVKVFAPESFNTRMHRLAASVELVNDALFIDRRRS